MPYFDYRARSAGGELVEGRMEAPSVDAAANQLLEGGVTPVQIAEGKAEIRWLQQLQERFSGGGSVELDDLILFCRQMHTLVKAGVPIVRALRGLIESAKKPALGRALAEVLEDLESGRELSAGLNRHPKVFPLLFVSTIQIGEGTGRLDEAFLALSRYLMREKETRDQVKAAMRYPTFVVVAISIAIAILSLFVIPTFQKVFKGFHMQLPLPTRIILAISNFSVTYWPYLLVAGILAFFLIRRYLQTEKGRFKWDRAKLRLPIVGSILLRATLSRLARSFSMSFSAGVPLLQALGITARAVDNSYIESKLQQMGNGIERGDTLTNTAAGTEIFTPLVLQMLAVGEETGAIDTMLNDVAEFYEREVDYDLKNLTSAIEPILIVAIGGMVLVLALGVFLPMWNLTQIAHAH